MKYGWVAAGPEHQGRNQNWFDMILCRTIVSSIVLASAAAFMNTTRRLRIDRSWETRQSRSYHNIIIRSPNMLR